MLKIYFVLAAICVGFTVAPVWAQRDLTAAHPITDGAAVGADDVVEYWLKRDVDPDTADQEGRTVIMLGAAAGSLPVVDLALRFGASVRKQDQFGNTPLTLAVTSGVYEITELLVNANSDPNHQNKNGITPLMIAASGGYLDIVRLLIENGANVRITDYAGRGPLGWARDSRDRAVMQALERAGAVD